MLKSLLSIIIVLLVSLSLKAQAPPKTLKAPAPPKVAIPPFNDKYSRTVKELEAGKLNTDFRAFRESFLESKQYKIAVAKAKVMDSLEKQMYYELDKSLYTAVIRTTKQMLSIDYTNMLAHKILRQTYTMAGDTSSARKYHDIQFGLLNSIVKSGNGKTCETAWHVVQISEENFIIKMLEAKVKQQSLVMKGGVCDKIDATVDGKQKTYFFETSLANKAAEKLNTK